MSDQPTSSGRFGSLMKKLKEGSDEFDPSLTADILPATQEPKLASSKRRVPGKKNNPEYTQTTAYIQRVLYDEATKRLIDEGRKRDYSDLLNDLLRQWLERQIEV